jgi:hypothetical protein
MGNKTFTASAPHDQEWDYMMTAIQTLALIPLDGRPVCRQWPQQLASMSGLSLLLLPQGPCASVDQLRHPIDLSLVSSWLASCPNGVPLIVALDTVLYGGLIPSRIEEHTTEVLQARLDDFWLQLHQNKLMAMGFSSILRIPNYANAQEEPAYWDPYGPLLYQYSSQVHQFGDAQPAVLQAIPADVLTDFTNRRQRHFAINQSILAHMAKDNPALDYVSFCQDDTGPYGLNVKEAQHLANTITKNIALNNKAHVQTGADEVVTALMARFLLQQLCITPSVFVVYSHSEGASITARFDGQPIKNIVAQQLQTCGARLAQYPHTADCWLVVHTPSPWDSLNSQNPQGDHCENIKANTTPDQYRHVLRWLNQANSEGKPIIVADVAYANGSDPKLTAQLLTHWTKPQHWQNLYGYAGWNTPGNAIGCALSMALIRWWAEHNGCFNAQLWQVALFTRLVDDALYQGEVRALLRAELGNEHVDIPLLNALMADGLALLKQRIGITTPVSCHFPAGRSFEIELSFDEMDSTYTSLKKTEDLQSK